MSFHKHMRTIAANSGVLWEPSKLTQVPPILLDDSSNFTIDVSGVNKIDNENYIDNYFYQDTDSRKPSVIDNELNGKRIIRFDGSNDFLRINSSGLDIFNNVPLAYVFFVTKKNGTDGTSTSRRIFSATISTSINVRFSIYNDDNSNPTTVNKLVLDTRRLNGDTYKFQPSTMAVDNMWVMGLGIMDYQNNRSRLYINGVLDGQVDNVHSASGNSDPSNSQSITIGSNLNGGTSWSGDVAAIVSGTFINDSDIDNLFGYYAHRYGLETLLPVDHVYKVRQPIV